MSSAGKIRKTFWKNGLAEAMKIPENIIDDSEKGIVIIKDKYPKARFHYLLLPTEVELNSAKELTASHIPLLQKMKMKVEQVLERLHKSHKSEFIIGFHAKPSMSHLHLHIISKDFLSPCLKTKKHWNSFNTEHFLELSDTIHKLENLGELLEDFPSDEEIELCLNRPLKCNQCSFQPKTMPALKNHLVGHSLPKSAEQ